MRAYKVTIKCSLFVAQAIVIAPEADQAVSLLREKAIASVCAYAQFDRETVDKKLAAENVTSSTEWLNEPGLINFSWDVPSNGS